MSTDNGNSGDEVAAAAGRTVDSGAGDVQPSPAGDGQGGGHLARTRDASPLAVTKRLQAEGRWAEVEPVRNEMMRAARKERGMSKTDAQAWVYAELDRLYPPPVPSPDRLPGDEIAQAAPRDSGQIRGLSDLPEDWPELPANASLSSEVGWVQANRLRIVTDQAGGATSVNLDRALSPAPSWAALGWLETSIRSYAKFVDVAAKATAVDDGEGAVMRRERVSLDDVLRLLDEMCVDDGGM